MSMHFADSTPKQTLVVEEFEKYWRKRKNDKTVASGLDLFDIRCLAQSLLTDEERQQMDEYMFHEEFLQILTDAINRNDTERLHETLVETKLNLNFFNLDGLSPLHIVCKMGHNEILQMLLQRGAQSNIIDKRHGHSPLQVAAMHGHHACVATLLQNNANICYANTETAGKTALHFACENGSLMCVKELLVSRELNLVKKNEITKIIQTTLNLQDNNGHTPLHLAVIDGNLACVKLLLEAGSNASTVNAEGKTALALARQMDNESIASLLLPYTSVTEPSSPVVVTSSSSPQHHPYAVLQSPSSTGGAGGGSGSSSNSSFSEAVEAEMGLFEGCSVVYENGEAVGSSVSVVQPNRFVIVSGDYLVEEESSRKIVLCTTRELADILSEKFTKQLNEVQLSRGNSNVLKSDMQGSTMNNNSNIFSQQGGGDWGRRKSLDGRSHSSDDIGKTYKRWAVSGVLLPSVGGIGEVAAPTNGGGSSPSGRSKKCTVVELPAGQWLTLSESVLYDAEASLLSLNSTPKNGISSGGSNGRDRADSAAVFVSQQLEAEDPLWEQYKQQHQKSVVVVTSLT